MSHPLSETEHKVTMSVAMPDNISAISNAGSLLLVATSPNSVEEAMEALEEFGKCIAITARGGFDDDDI